MAKLTKPCRTLLRFKQQGIDSLTPIATIEKRYFGLLVDSWLIYQFRNGKIATSKDLPEVIDQLHKLHSLGYRHDDPNFENFIWSAEGKMFLIDCKGRPRLGLFSDYYDFMLISQRNREINDHHVEAIVNFDRTTIGYRMASFYRGYKTLRSRLKQRYRNP